MNKPRKAIIICSPDAYANSIKAGQIKKLLDQNNFSTDVYPTNALSRLSVHKVICWLPGLRFLQVKTYFFEITFLIGYRLRIPSLRWLVSYTLKRTIELRGNLLRNLLSEKNYDLLVCESGLDEGLFLGPRIAKIQILDLPVPLAEEMYFGGVLSVNGFKDLQNLEKRIYGNSDYLSFHWHTYADFVRRTKYNGKNQIESGYGTVPKSVHATFSNTPRIIFLGYLKGYWVNLPLLKSLCKLYPGIDIYGGPKPSDKLLLSHYKGYAPTTEILADYQFGLITITDDPLRRQSFSSKHLEYVSYGLPVLTPKWRHDTILESSSIHYTADNFASQILKYSNEKEWSKKSNAAIKIAGATSWDNALKPIKRILDSKL